MQYRINFPQQKDSFKMIRIFFICIGFIYIIMLLKYAVAKSKMVTVLPALSQHDVLLFKRFKENYNKVYPDKESEQKGYTNFVNNLAEVIELNRQHSSNAIFYKLNRYADLDPKELNERFVMEITPYNTEHENKDAIETEDSNDSPEDLHVYDQDEVDDMYTTWIKKWGKSELKKQLFNVTNYFSLVKTALESNKQKLAGNDVSLSQDDQVREPNKFF